MSSDITWREGIRSEDVHRRNFFLANRKLLEKHAEPKSLKREKKKRNYEEEEIERVAAVKARIRAAEAELIEKMKMNEYVPMHVTEPRCLEMHMREVPDHVLGLIKEPKGTKKYMAERFKTWPRDKYYCRETTYYDYGWFNPLPRGKKFPQFSAIKDALYRKRGVARNPDWYQETAIANPTVCTVAKT